MFKNREVKIYVLIYTIISILVLVGVCLYTYNSYNNYKKIILNNDNYILESIIESHPELEQEIVESIINSDNKQINSLKDYGLEDSKTLDYINNNEKILKINLFKNLLVAIIILFMLFILFILFIKYIYNKINHISTYTCRVLNDDYQMDIRDYNEGTISTLKNDIYKMTIKIKESEDKAKRDKLFLENTLGDISHQLKTPLTSMYVINDILYNENDKNIRNDFLNKNKEQLERIEWLITSILKISRLDSGTIKLNYKKVNVLNMINKTIKPLLIPAELKNVEIRTNSLNNIFINVDYNWTSEALLNIIKNAFEHTKSYVEINVKDNPIYTEIIIKDDGNGIDKLDMPHIFERFYKGKTSNKNSIGIGLNMAKTIINKENGDIFVETSDSGTIFKVKIFKNII